MKNNLEERYRSVIEDNVNISERNDLKEFFILLLAIFAIGVSLFFCSDKIACFFIDRMSYDTQIKIEKVLRSFSIKQRTVNSKEIYRLRAIKNNIVKLDKRLNKNPDYFQIYIDRSNEINAFIIPDGTIYVTQGLLKQKFATDEVLTFVIAHEIGHYVHRDILKSISRTLIVGGIEIVLGGNSQFSNVMQNVNYFSNIAYSQSAETKADLYANKVVKTLYGTNRGAVEFFEQLDKKYEVPEFMHYFSTHPSPKKRIQTISEF